MLIKEIGMVGPKPLERVLNDDASAAFRVGYQDPSHFSRKYKRHFGAAPHGDIASLRSRLEV